MQCLTLRKYINSLGKTFDTDSLCAALIVSNFNFYTQSRCRNANISPIDFAKISFYKKSFLNNY